MVPETFVGFTFCVEPVYGSETCVGFTFVKRRQSFIYLFEPKMVTSHCVFSNLM